jgi:hypothetical protein
MLDEFDSRVLAQGHAILESLRSERNSLVISVLARKEQRNDALDAELKRKLSEYIAHLENAIMVADEIREYVRNL